VSDQQRPDGGHAQDTELQDSNPNAAGPERAAGGLGVSSERVGPTGPGQESTDGERDTRQAGTSGDPVLPEDTPAEQSTGNPEPQPEGLAPRADYPSKDPRSD
jgi:hypothetical protein